MPKLKTHKATAKRFKKTKTGKFQRRYSGQNHYNAKERSKTRGKKRRMQRVNRTVHKSLKKLLPN